jgi:hypothetical protein
VGVVAVVKLAEAVLVVITTMHQYFCLLVL